MGDQQAWDDTDLVAEWNAAKREYQKYHSYAARGEPIPPEDLVALDQNGDGGGDNASKVKNSSTPVVESEIRNEILAASTDQTTGRDSTFGATVDNSAATNSHLPPVPDAMMSHVQDDDLKKLLMSWYYSGYYTGRYEGKQEAYAEMRAQYNSTLAKNSRSRAKD